MAPDETIDRPAGKTAGTKDKLRALILHPATPEAERRSALRRLEVLLARDGAGKPQAGLEITRSRDRKSVV